MADQSRIAIAYAYEPPTGGYKAARLRTATNPAMGFTADGYAGPFSHPLSDPAPLPFLVVPFF